MENYEVGQRVWFRYTPGRQTPGEILDKYEKYGKTWYKIYNKCRGMFTVLVDDILSLA